MKSASNKRKIFNDPIYGFISIPDDIILDIIDHPYFQRLRRIKQLGLTHLVYPGALHTRFHHAVGCTYLMQKAISSLELKGHTVTKEEKLGATIAILLHDIGHGPFSHALEHSLVDDVHHEDLSLMIMEQLNKEFDGKLSLAIQIFKNEYPKKFLHQLVSSQLDVDRLDYLKRDSFYSGVSEGVVSSERILDMLDLHEDNLVVQQKGIYSIEKFIVARRLMYWQVYLHKTVISAEFMLVKVLERAKYLAKNGADLFCSPALKKFLYNDLTKSDFQRKEILESFINLDDYDVMGAIKVWMTNDDKTLGLLCHKLVNRDLFKVKILDTEPTTGGVEEIKKWICESLNVSQEEADYFLINEGITNNAYNASSDSILLRFKDGSTKDISEASDNLNIQALSEPVKKHFVCYPV